MGKELETIEQVTSCGELHNKLVEAEEAKAEIEAILLKRVSYIFRSTEKYALMCVCGMRGQTNSNYLCPFRLFEIP